jgi:acyl-CoA reductase-like NAD-dependent aldehyde dehydrogenase
VELIAQGAYFLSSDEKEKVAAVLMRSNGTMNPQIVGKTAGYIAEIAGIKLPDNVKILIGEETLVGSKVPFSREKLCPVLAFYVESDWEAACKTCIEILMHEGAGHTMTIHSNNEAVIREFALKKPVSRILVNTPAALGGIGATTNLFPALTLGCGAIGGSSTSDNICPLNLINVRRLAYGVRELSDVSATRAEARCCEGKSSPPTSAAVDDKLMQAVIARVLEKLGKL